MYSLRTTFKNAFITSKEGLAQRFLADNEYIIWSVAYLDTRESNSVESTPGICKNLFATRRALL